jgi:hypothetical protein
MRVFGEILQKMNPTVSVKDSHCEEEYRSNIIYKESLT